jgi:hypothetical protein
MIGRTAILKVTDSKTAASVDTPGTGVVVAGAPQALRNNPRARMSKYLECWGSMKINSFFVCVLLNKHIISIMSPVGQA